MSIIYLLVKIFGYSYISHIFIILSINILSHYEYFVFSEPTWGLDIATGAFVMTATPIPSRKK